jgi:transcriptional regulator with XRE-family HTH domain
VDDLKVGLEIRAVRIRRGWRQSDVATAAGFSQALVSLIERGGLDRLSLRSIRRAGEVLGIRLELDPRWHGSELSKLLDERHATVVLAASRRLSRAGRQVTVERTFSFYGERGSIDIVAWHAELRAFLIIEVKSELVDLASPLLADGMRTA